MTLDTNELLDKWHQIVFERDLDGLQEILAEDVEFRSPVLWKPYHGRFPAFVLLSNVIEIFEGFTYHREIISGNIWALEFSANIGDLSLKGIDLIEFNADGKIQKFEVFIRPANALLAVGEEMRRRLS
jgi:hypothetical protein